MKDRFFYSLVWIVWVLPLFASCTNYSPVAITPTDARITITSSSIDSPDIVTWPLMKRLDPPVSKGFRFVAHLPLIRESDLARINERAHVNAWLVRVYQNRSGSREIGRKAVPIAPDAFNPDSSFDPDVSIVVQYSVSKFANTFVSTECPPGGHNKSILSAALSNEPSTQNQMLIAGGLREKVEEEFQLAKYGSRFDGGDSLIGDYNVEIALYDRDSKTTQSSSYRLPATIHIENETRVDLGECPEPSKESVKPGDYWKRLQIDSSTD